MQNEKDLPFTFLGPFLLFTFSLSWGILGLYMISPDGAAEWFGALSGTHPLFYLAVWSPSLSAAVLIAGWAGREGLGRFFSRLGLWNLSWKWGLFLLLAVPLPFFLGAAVEGRALSMFPGELPAAAVPGVLLLMLVKGPVEELGWRGLLLPMLQRRMRPLFAALAVGGIWGLWHFPAFVLSGTPQSAWNFSAFFAGTVALSVLATVLYNRSGGSLLVAVLFHFQVILPLWPDGQPADTFFFIGLAVLTACLNPDLIWSRTPAVTRVLPLHTRGGRS